MKRFFSTFLLLSVVASSLVISNNLSKQNEAQYAAQKSDGIQKSIDLSEADIYHVNRNNVFVSFPN